MSRSETIDLDDRLSAFVESEIAKGRFRSAQEVVRAALSLLEDERRVAELRAALIEGEESGPAEPFDIEEFLRERRGSAPRA